MVVTVNEQLRDASIRHQIALHRLGAGTAAQVNELLDAVKNDLVAQIAKFDPTTDGGYSKARLEKMLAAIKKINAAAYSDVGDFLNEHLVDLAQYEADYQATHLDKTLPFDWPLTQPSVDALASLVTTEPFAGRLLDEWVSGLEAGQLDRITAALRIGLVEGETVDQLAKRLRGTKALQYKDGILDIGKRQAENVVRTATSHVTNSAKEAFYKANDDLVEKMQFHSTLDLRTTIMCAVLDGTVWAMGEPHPMIPQHINCRSLWVPVIKSWQDIGIDAGEIEGSRASVNGQVSSAIKYPEWLKKQPLADVEEALGTTRAQLFLRGDLKLSRFMDPTGQSYTLDELRVRDAAAFAKAGVE